MICPIHCGLAVAMAAMPSRSIRPMMTTSEVSLNSPMALLTSAGITMRSACGSTISTIRW